MMYQNTREQNQKLKYFRTHKKIEYWEVCLAMAPKMPTETYGYLKNSFYLEKIQFVLIFFGFLKVIYYLFTVGVKLLPPPRGFRELSWTRPPVYEIPFHEKIFLDRSNRGGGEVIWHPW